jgi:VIT1/CCC1 family predicted Fe2+/Mn2+ transporter
MAHVEGSGTADARVTSITKTLSVLTETPMQPSLAAPGGRHRRHQAPGVLDLALASSRGLAVGALLPIVVAFGSPFSMATRT